MAITFANESVEYRAARDALLDQEIGLRRQMEAVAEARRALPPGPVVENEYVFEGLGEDGKPTRIRLSEMFRAGTDSLMIYHYMFPRYPSDDRAGAASGETARLPNGGAALPLLHRPARPARCRRAAFRSGWRQFRCSRKGAARPNARRCARPGLAAFAHDLVGRQRLQARLSRRI